MTARQGVAAWRAGITIPQHVGEAAEINYSGEAAPDYGPLARDRIPVRSMAEGDLRALVAIDRRITGRDRAAYFQRKLADALTESDVRVSLVAELDGGPVGFIMARVDLGEFGRVETTAVIDTIGVDPDYRNKGVGRALGVAAPGQPRHAARREGAHRSRLARPRSARLSRPQRLPARAAALLRPVARLIGA